MKLKRLVAKNITRIRIDAGLSKKDLGSRAKIDPSRVTRLETGTANLTLDMIERLAKALNVTPSKILAGKLDEVDLDQGSPELIEYALGMMRKSVELLESAKRR